MARQDREIIRSRDCLWGLQGICYAETRRVSLGPGSNPRLIPKSGQPGFLLGKNLPAVTASACQGRKLGR
ncbi:MAG: hypothetical protein ACYDIC_17180 [Desulfobaccales bacterium]